MKLRNSVMNEDMISSAELSRAACCNLGESFVTNPSVDVTYSDAATGAKQIKLLGLSGTYVQMMTENIPNYRGSAAPYGLGYVPGPWMQSIQVSKGSSSVKNGYEAITGQINVEFKKPQLPEADWFSANLFASSTNRYEANADATVKLSKRWSTSCWRITRMRPSSRQQRRRLPTSPAWSSTTSGTAGHTWATATFSKQASKCLRKTATADKSVMAKCL